MAQAAGRADVRELRLVVFELGGERFGLPIESVREVVRPVPLTPLPEVADLAGVMRLRESVIPVVDLRQRLALPDRGGQDHRIAVVEIGELVAGLIVDGVREVRTVAAADVEPPSPLVRGPAARFVAGVAKQPDGLIVVLNLAGALFLDDLWAAQAHLDNAPRTEVNA